MRKLLQKSSIFIVTLLMLLSTILVALNHIDFSLLRVRAEYSCDYAALTDEELDKLSFRTTISEEAPQMTVFTHGYGGQASHWSNDGNRTFEYEENSMIENLRRRIDKEENGAVVIRAEVEAWTDSLSGTRSKEEAKSIKANDNQIQAGKDESVKSVSSEVQKQDGAASLRENYRYYGLPGHTINLNYCEAEKGEYASPEDSVIHNLKASDVSKHIIIVFNATPETTDENHDIVYSQLEYILDALSYQYCQLTGKLPTYNLIAHSRGGITNMQYALGHPYNVASLYSMGTPYNGSAFGGSNVGNTYPFLAIGGEKKKYVYKDNDKQYKDYNPGVWDILDTDLNESYKSFWNSHYDWYRHIKFTPIGSYVTAGFFLQTAIDALNVAFIHNDKFKKIAQGVLKYTEVMWGIGSVLTTKRVMRKIVHSEIDLLKDFLHRELDVSISEPWIQVLNNIRTLPVLYPHLGVSYSPLFVVADDLFIDLDSQIAFGYQGAHVRVKLMDSYDQSRQGKSVPEAPANGHNLETHDPEIISHIVGDLNIGAGEAKQFDVRYTENGCYIVNLNFFEEQLDSAGKPKSDQILDIPETYNGSTVLGIDSLTKNKEIYGETRYNTQITRINLPKTIKEISDFAFYGMSNLKSVHIASGSNLENIEQGAFMNCSSLTSVSLPASVKRIGVGAFMGCSSLTNFAVGDNVELIGANAFSACDKLTSINVASGNSVYSSQEGVLFNKDKTNLAAYPCGKTSASYTLPSEVKEIDAWAFYGNQFLQAIDLNQVTMVRKYAFANCSKLGTISANEVKYAEIGVVEETPWLNGKTGDFIMLGGALLEYCGSAEQVVLEQGIISVVPFAFSENTKLKSVTINNELINIGDSAFYKCENLSAVYINNNSQMVFIGTNVFGENAAERKIYIPRNLYGEYKEDDFWKAYTDSLTVHQTKIRFNSNGGSACEDGSVDYTGYIGALPKPNKQGYVFLGWYDNAAFTGKKVEEGRLWTSLTDEITLYAQYREKSTAVYPINYYPNGGTIDDDAVHSYTSDDEVILPAVEKLHYTFEGWYYDAAFTQPVGAGWMTGETGVKYVYAKWKGVSVSVTIINELNVFLGGVRLEYGAKGYLPSYRGEVKTGYVFSGWAVQNSTEYVQIADANRRLLNPWDKYEDTTLRVKPIFTPIVYDIAINLPSGVSNPGIPTSYTVETATIDLPDVSLSGYRFREWQSDGQKISSISKGSTGNKTITPVFDQLYTISFNANGGTSRNSIQGIKGESIKLPFSSRVGCTGKWEDYAFGSTYIIQENDTLFAIWTPNVYKINYKILDKIVKVGSYTYYDDNLVREQALFYDDHELWMATPEDTTWYIFDGWYLESSFTSKTVKLASGTLGGVTVYGRWKYVRTGTFTVTDDGVFKQPSDWISFQKITGYTLSQLKAKGYHSITFTGELTVWQKNDGYKYMRVYDGTGTNAKQISEWWVDHPDGKKERIYQLNNDGSWTINLDSLTSDTLCFRYTASGNFDDTWYNKDFGLSIKSLNK